MAECVITAVGPDRPGLVDELTGALHDHQANIADSRMVNLRGRFAVILLVELPDATADEVCRDLAGVGERIGLIISIAPQTGSIGAASGVPYRLRTYAMDQQGIVHRITHVLHAHKVNIEELQTRLEPGSVTGTPLFTMELRMVVPAGVRFVTLRRQLEALCDELNCDMDLEPA